MALNQNLPTIVIEMLKNNIKLTQNLDDSSKKLLHSLIETLTQGQDGNSFGAPNPEQISLKSANSTASSSMIDEKS